MTRRSLAIVGFACLGLAGCQTVSKGLVGEEHENLAPFADVTVEFLGADSVDLRDNELVYLRRYVDSDAAEIDRLRALLAQADRFRDLVVYYSVELVRISDTAQSEQAKAFDLATTLEEQFQSYFLNEAGVSHDRFAAAVAEVRSSATFLGALRAVQPLIVLSGEHYEIVIREVEDEALPAAWRSIDAAIEAEFQPVIDQLEVIHARRYELMQGLQMIRAYRLGDKTALDGINDGTIIVNRSFKLPTLPNDRQLDATKDHLIGELEKEGRIWALLEGDVDDYLATRTELDRELAEINDGLHVARRQVVAWIRGHQALADGVRDPGKWLKAIFQVAEGVRSVR